MLFLCVQGIAIHLYSPAGNPHQVVLVLELEEGRNSDICAGSACDRSDRLATLFSVLSVRPV